MSMSQSDQPKRWEVISQRQTIDLQPDGSIGQVVEVTFKLTDGTTGRVTIPLRSYNVDTARDAINYYADHLDAVSKLQG